MTLASAISRRDIGAAVLLLAGCGPGDGTPESLFSVRDSAGVTIAENLAPAFEGPLTVEEPGLFTIENDFGSPENFLFDIRGVHQFSDGRLVVGNAGTRELFYFGEDGSFAGSAGGPGEGPDELESLFALVGCASGSVAIQERTRYGLFDQDGNAIRKVRVAGHLAERTASLIALSPDCESALVLIRTGGSPPPDVSVFERIFPMYWVHLSDGARDTVGMIPALDVQAIELNGRRVGSRRPFGREAVWDAAGEVAVVGLAFDFEFQRIDRNGGHRIVRWPGEARPVSEADWSYFLDKQEEYRLLDPEEAQFMPEEDEYSVPATKPPYSKLLTDDLGRVWLQQYDRFTYFAPEPSTRWWVFRADGRWLATVTMPEELEVMSVSRGRVIGVRRNAFDLEEVGVYRLPRELDS